jgi:hypothetical protein
LAAKRAFPAQSKAVGLFVHRLNQRPQERPTLPESLRGEMVAAFKDDVLLLAELLKRDLSHWCQTERTWPDQRTG